jgi:dedicator of cytokinesis protein 3
MLAFHETLESFFRKNFEEEMLRLSFDAPTECGVAPSSLYLPDAPSYALSLADAISIDQSSSSTTRCIFRHSLPLCTGVTHNTSPFSFYLFCWFDDAQPTRLQKHITHLARHGMNAVAFSPGEGIDSYKPSDGFALLRLASGLLRERHGDGRAFSYECWYCFH